MNGFQSVGRRIGAEFILQCKRKEITCQRDACWNVKDPAAFESVCLVAIRCQEKLYVVQLAWVRGSWRETGQFANERDWTIQYFLCAYFFYCLMLRLFRIKKNKNWYIVFVHSYAEEHHCHLVFQTFPVSLWFRQLQNHRIFFKKRKKR